MGKLACPLCGVHTSSKRAAVGHARRCHLANVEGRDDERWDCPVCGEPWSDGYAQARHVAAAHCERAGDHFWCPCLCGFMFTNDGIVAFAMHLLVAGGAQAHLLQATLGVRDAD